MLEELRKLAHVEPIEVKESPALELSTHTFRPVVTSEALSKISLTPVWRVAAALVCSFLSIVMFYPWSHGAMADYFTIVSHPAAVVTFYVAVILVSPKAECFIRSEVVFLSNNSTCMSLQMMLGVMTKMV